MGSGEDQGVSGLQRKGRDLETHGLSWNPSLVPWLCDLGKLLNLSEAQFPHPQNKDSAMECYGTNTECHLVPKVAVLGDGRTVRSWDLVGDSWVIGDASLKRDSGSPPLPSLHVGL